MKHSRNSQPGRFPPWLRRPWASGRPFEATKGVIDGLRLHTVCQSARCPNIGECWAKGTATVMVLGNTCTRNCSFCSVPSGHPGGIEGDEPVHVAQAVRQMGLRHAVVTTVVRDDLPDSGAGHIAETIRAIRDLNPATTVEVLVSDFRGDGKAIDAVLDAGPEVFGHNIETVRRLYPRVRDRRFAYDGALRTLLKAREYSQRVIVKSALMVGHGETHDDVTETLRDLRGVGVDVVCIGQYLQPSPKQADVVEYVHPDAFEEYKAKAYEIGFEFVVSGPFVRSSYRSEEVLETAFARERLGLTATPAGRR